MDAPAETELDYARRRLAEVQATYTRPDEQQYLALLVGAWRYHIKIFEQQEAEQHDHR